MRTHSSPSQSACARRTLLCVEGLVLTGLVFVASSEQPEQPPPTPDVQPVDELTPVLALEVLATEQDPDPALRLVAQRKQKVVLANKTGKEITVSISPPNAEPTGKLFSDLSNQFSLPASNGEVEATVADNWYDETPFTVAFDGFERGTAQMIIRGGPEVDANPTPTQPPTGG